MEYEIRGWSGYYLHITENEINVYSSWGFGKGKPFKGNLDHLLLLIIREENYPKELVAMDI